MMVPARHRSPLELALCSSVVALLACGAWAVSPPLAAAQRRGDAAAEEWGDPAIPEEGEPAPQEPARDSEVLAAPAPLTAALGAGAGFGQRTVRVPARAGEYAIDSGFFPVLDVLLAGEVAAGDRARLGAQAHYQTSVGLTTVATPPGGSVQETSMRSQHLDFGLSAGLRFGDTASSVSARLYAGWAFRGLRTVVDISVPPYTLHGPVVRPELSIPIAGGAAVLRLAPELFVLSHVTAELRHFGSTSSAGLAFGGEAALDVRLSWRLQLTLAYCESRARVSTPWGEALRDDQRFGTLRLALFY